MKKPLMTLLLAVGLMGAVAAVPASAQQAGGGGGGRRGGGNFDPAAFRQQMQDRMKTAMAATDDEWKVLQPKIDKVQTLQAASRGGFGGGRPRGGNAAGGDAAAPAAPPAPPADASAVTKAAYELRITLDKKDATPEEIKAKLTALRDARVKAKEELTKAQEELKSVASVRQEAVLVRDGLLE